MRRSTFWSLIMRGLACCCVMVMAARGWSATTPDPVLSPASGNYDDAVLVQVSAGSKGAQARYTLDGSTPTQASSLYSGPFELTENATVTVRSFQSGATPSANIAHAFVVTAQTKKRAAMPTFSPVPGTYISNVSVTLATTTTRATIRYTLDGTAPTQSSPLYSAPLALSATTTIQAQAFRNGYQPSTVAVGTYTIVLPTVATPTIAPGSGTYGAAQSVTLADATPGASIRYTLDGSVPSATSTLYAGPITINATRTLTARAFVSGYQPSTSASALYTLVPALPSISPNGGVFADTVAVTLSTPTSGATIHYTLDGSDPTAASPTASSAVSVARNATLLARAFVPGWTPSAAANAAFTIQVAAPSITPAAGTYSQAQTITLASTTTGADLHYTLDGSAPTTASPSYTAPFTLAASATVKAIALRAGATPSAVTSATYVLQAATPTATPAGGTFSDVVTLTLTTATTGAAIHYTLDGSDPTSSSPTASGPLVIDHSATLTARAFQTGWTTSYALVASYTLVLPPPSISPNGGTSSDTVPVTLGSTTAGAEIHYTLDGSDPTPASPGGAAPVLVSVDHGATLTARTFRTGWTTSAPSSAAFSFQVATPTLTPVGGTFTGSVVASGTTATAGAELHYTTDGSTPSAASPILPASLTLSSTTTLTVVGLRAGFTASAATTATFTVIPATSSALAVVPAVATVAIGGSRQFAVATTDGSALPSPISWSVNQGGSVSTSGIFTASALGTATITASGGGQSASATVNVVQGPTFTLAASASPLEVSGLTTVLQAQGTDDAGPASALTYTWFAIGASPSGTIFSVNGSNAAQTTTVTFAHAGTYVMRVTIADPLGLSASSEVQVVVHPTPTQLTVSPAMVAVNPTGSAVFTATALDQFGTPVALTAAPTWTVSAGGVIDANGLFTGSTVGGPYTVTALSGALSATAAVSVTSGPVITSISATPSPVTGTTVALTVQASDPRGPASLIYQWSLTDSSPSGVDFSENGTTNAASVTARFARVGTYTFLVTVTDTSTAAIATGAVTVTVVATPSQLRVAPVTAALHPQDTQLFSAETLDQFGLHLATASSLSWSATSGSITASGVFTAAVAGSATITATAGALSGSATVTVTAPVVAFLSVTPVTTGVVPNGTQAFSVTAHDASFSPLPVPPNLIWSVSGGGTIDGNGLFTAGTATGGPFTVTATSGSVSGQATVTVANAPTISVAASASPTLVTGTTTSLSVQGADDGGAGALTYGWAVLSGPGYVSFSPNNTNAAQSSIATFYQAGTYALQVTVTNAAGLTATSAATVTVVNTLTTLYVAPATITLAPGGTQPFMVSGYSQFGSYLSALSAPSWSASGGTIASSGLFTAGSSVGGPFTVQATIGSVSAQASVRIAQAPTVAVAASASPNPVTGTTTTTLSVLGADAGGASSLTYRWAVSGASSYVSFSDNYSATASTTTATFYGVGTYLFQVTITNAAGLTTTSSVAVTVTPTLSSLRVMPSSVVVATGGTQPFSVDALDQFHNLMTAPGNTTWSVDGGGIIDATGLLSAGGIAGGPFTVTATNGTISGQATLTIASPPTILTAATASPNPVTGTTTTLSVQGDDAGGASSLLFTWSALDPSPSGVTFSANYSATASTTTATFTQAGTYLFRVVLRNPAGLTASSTVTVSVTQTPTTFSVLPPTITLGLNATRAFAAELADQFGTQMAVSPLWSVSGDATIDGLGTVTTGAVAGTATITASAGTLTASALVTVVNTAPVISEVSATPNPVTTGTALVSAVASDDGGAAALTYTWSTIGSSPAGVVFSANGTNAAQSAIATFSHIGSYTMQVVVRDALGLSSTGTMVVTVASLLGSPQLSPAGGIFVNPISLTLSGQPSDPPGTQIWYTLGASPADPVPGASGALLFTHPITIAANATLKAVSAVTASDGTQVVSPVVSGTFRFLDLTAITFPRPLPPGGNSAVSPYCELVQLAAGDPSFSEGVTVGIDGNGVAANAVHVIGDHLAYADVPLAVGKPTTITSHIGTGSQHHEQSQQVTWSATDLAGKVATTDTIVIRRGDSLLFTDSTVDQQWVFDAGTGSSLTPADLGVLIPTAYPNAGRFVAKAFIGSAEVGSILVEVVDVPFTNEMIACEVNYKRSYKVSIQPGGSAADVSFTAADSSVLTVSVDGTEYDDVTLGLKPLKRGMPVVLARIGGADGPIVSAKEIDEFTLDQPAKDGLIGPGFSFSSFIVRPYLANLEFKFVVPDPRANIFPLDVKSYSLTPRFDAKTKEVIGTFRYECLAPQDYAKNIILPLIWSLTTYQLGETPPGGGDKPLVQVSKGDSLTAITSQIRLTVANAAKASEQATAEFSNAQPVYLTTGLTFHPDPAYPGLQSSGSITGAVNVTMTLVPPNPVLLQALYREREQSLLGPDIETIMAVDPPSPVVDATSSGTGPFYDPLTFRGLAGGLSVIPQEFYRYAIAFDDDGDGIPDEKIVWVDVFAEPKLGSADFSSGSANMAEAGIRVTGAGNGESTTTAYLATARYVANTDFGANTTKGFETRATTLGSQSWDLVYRHDPTGTNPPVVIAQFLVAETMNTTKNTPLTIALDATGSATVQVTLVASPLAADSTGLGKLSVYNFDFFGGNGFGLFAGLGTLDMSMPLNQPTPFTFTVPGHYSFSSSTGGSLDIIVQGTAVHLAGIYGNYTGNLGSAGEDGPFNTQQFPQFTVDAQGIDGTTRLSELNWIPSHGNIPDILLYGYALLTDSASGAPPVTLRRDDTNVGAYQYRTVNSTQVPVSIYATDSAMTGSLQVIKDAASNPPAICQFYKDDEVNFTFEVNGRTQRTFRMLRFSEGLGLPGALTATATVCPEHAWVNTDNGNLIFTAPVEHYETPAMGPDLAVFYNNQDHLDCGLGRGWRTNYDMRIYRTNGEAVLLDQTSERIFFQDGYHAPAAPGDHRAASIVVHQDQVDRHQVAADWKSGEEYKLVRNDNRLYYFNNDGWLVRIRQLNGEELHVQRDSSGIAQRVMDDHGRSLDLSRSAFGAGTSGGDGKAPIDRLSYRKSGEWSFVYDTSPGKKNGNLTAFTVKGTFGQYSPAQSVASITYQIDYDDRNRATDMRIVSAGQPQLAEKIEYPTDTVHVTTVTDVLGGKTVYSNGLFQFVDAGNIHHWMRGVPDDLNTAGITRFSSWIGPADWNPSTYAVPDSARMRHDIDFDALGNLVGETVFDRTGHHQRSVFTYTDLRDQVATIEGANLLRESRVVAVDGIVGAGALDLVSSMVYETAEGKKRGRMIAARDAAGSTTTYAFDSDGFPTSMVDARRHTWTYADLDAYGLPATVTAPPVSGQTTRSVARIYDANHTGLVMRVTDQQSHYTTEFGYDDQGRQSSVKPPGQPLAATSTFDPFGHLVKTTDLEGLTSTFGYDSIGRPTLAEKPGASPLLTTYARSGDEWLITTNQGGAQIAQRYEDTLGRVTAAIDMRTLVFGDPAASACETDSTFDADYGWITRVEDARFNTTTFDHDLIGRVIKTTTPLAEISSTVYNGLGWVLSTTDADSRTSSVLYSPTGQVRLQTNSAGGTIETAYDPTGNVVSQQPRFGAATRFEYDDDGVLSARIDALGQRVEQTIDAANQQIITKLAGVDATKTTVQLDGRGYRSSVTNALGVATMLAYNDGSIHTVQPPGRGVTTRDREASTARTSRITVPLATTSGAAATEVPTYDPTFGMVASTTDAKKRLVTSTIAPSTGEVNGVGDNAHSGNLQQTTPIQTILERDRSGNVLRYEDAQHHQVAQTFDEDNRLKTRTEKGVQTQWTYYASGLVYDLTRAGTRTTYLYDQLGLAKSVQTTGRSAQTSTYDCMGTLLSRSDGLTTTDYRYEPTTRQLEQTRESGGRTTSYLRDARGRVQNVLDSRGNGAHYDYDDFDRVTTITHADLRWEAFTYTPTGEIATHRDRAGRVTAMAYDPSGRKQSMTYQASGRTATFLIDLPSAGGTVETTQFAGDTTTRGSDVRGRLTTLALPGAEPVSTVYNEIDQPLSSGSASATTVSAYDGAGRLSDLTQPGVGTVHLTYDANGRVQMLVAPNGVGRTYGYDGAGAVNALTQTAGGAVESWSVTRDGQGRIARLSGPRATIDEAYDLSGRLAQEARAGDLPAVTQFAYDGADNRTWVVRFDQPQAQSESFAAGVVPATVVAQSGAWQVSAGALVATGSGAVDASAQLALTTDPQVRGPTVSVVVSPAIPDGSDPTATSSAGFALSAADGGSFRALWQRAPWTGGGFSPPVARGRLLVLHLPAGGGAATEVAAGAWSADDGLAKTIEVTVWPDERLTARLPAGTSDGLRIEAPALGLSSASAGMPAIFLVAAATGASGASATASATFNNLAWTSAGSRTTRHAQYDAFNQLVSDDEASTDPGVPTAHSAFTFNDLGQLTSRTRTRARRSEGGL